MNRKGIERGADLNTEDLRAKAIEDISTSIAQTIESACRFPLMRALISQKYRSFLEALEENRLGAEDIGEIAKAVMRKLEGIRGVGK